MSNGSRRPGVFPASAPVAVSTCTRYSTESGKRDLIEDSPQRNLRGGRESGSTRSRCGRVGGMSIPERAVSPLFIGLFGPFEVRRNGVPIPRLRTRKGQWLLALLTLRHGHAVERGWLAATLWPDSPDCQAAASLRR